MRRRRMLSSAMQTTHHTSQGLSNYLLRRMFPIFFGNFANVPRITESKFRSAFIVRHRVRNNDSFMNLEIFILYLCSLYIIKIDSNRRIIMDSGL